MARSWRGGGAGARGGVRAGPCLTVEYVVTILYGSQVCLESEKAASNLRKHGVSFDLAIRVFFDPLAVSGEARIEGGEWRLQTLGMVGGTMLLLVAHTVDDDKAATQTIRIISARRAEPKERRRYERENYP